LSAEVVMTMPALLEEQGRRYGDHPAVVDGSVRLSYAALAEQARAVARSLVALGVEPNDRIAIWAPNRVEFILAMLGAQCRGASVVPLNTRYRGHEARVILERSRASVLVVSNGFLGVDYVAMLRDSAGSADSAAADGVIPGLPHLRAIIDVGDGSRPDVTTWTAFLDLARRTPVTVETTMHVEPDTICDILFTSGTTGAPKGVMSTHRQTIGVAETWARGARLSETDRYAVVNPFFHGFGYKAGVITALTAGTTIYPVPVFDPVDLMKLIERERITVLPGTPTIFTTLLNHPRLRDFDLSSLRFAVAGAASVPETLFEQMLDVLGFESVGQAYGLTECIVATQSRANEDPRHVAETTGPAVPGIEIRVVDEAGQDVPLGTDGEIVLRGELVMVGYFEDEAATKAAFDPDGWFHTGDVGRFDEHGCLKITDRIKDMFTVGGFNVYPAEVENALGGHPDVIESAVVGVPDDRLGSVARAYVVARPESKPSATELTGYLRSRLANFKVPREFVLVDDLPRGASGKVLKRELRDPA